MREVPSEDCAIQIAPQRMMNMVGSSLDQESREMHRFQSEKLIQIPVMLAFLVFLLFSRQQQDGLIGEFEQRNQLNDL
jgi:hypothetical protein